jgi:hypothetical protein
MEKQGRVLLESPQFGKLSLGLQYCTREIIGALFALKEPALIVHEEGDEADEVTILEFDELVANKTFMVVGEEELRDDDEVVVQESKCHFFFLVFFVVLFCFSKKVKRNGLRE